MLVIREEVSMPVCCHEEADTRIMFYLHHILAANNGESISIRSSDTEVFILLLPCLESHNLLYCLDGCWSKQQQYQDIYQHFTAGRSLAPRSHWCSACSACFHRLRLYSLNDEQMQTEGIGADDEE